MAASSSSAPWLRPWEEMIEEHVDTLEGCCLGLKDRRSKVLSQEGGSTEVTLQSKFAVCAMRASSGRIIALLRGEQPGAQEHW